MSSAHAHYLSILLIFKSIPIVAIKEFVKTPSQYLLMNEVLPTHESPTKRTLYLTSFDGAFAISSNKKADLAIYLHE